jgi:hypothetical protein
MATDLADLMPKKAKNKGVLSHKSPSVAQQHPDNQFSIQKRAGHFNKKYKSGAAAQRQSPSTLTKIWWWGCRTAAGDLARSNA